MSIDLNNDNPNDSQSMNHFDNQSQEDDSLSKNIDSKKQKKRPLEEKIEEKINNEVSHSKQKIHENSNNIVNNNNVVDSYSVRIDGFLRPFTLKQARDMIEEKTECSLLEVY